MVVVFIPNVVMDRFHLHHAYLRRQDTSYTHQRYRLLQQQQRQTDPNLRKESHVRHEFNKMPERFMWMFPGMNLLKLNTDGSSKGNPGPSSFGGLIRDHNGKWLCGYLGKMKGKCYTSLEAEVWSIFKGLCLIKERNFSNVLIETDCVAALLLGVGQLDQDHPLSSLMKVINTLMMEQKCVMVHTRRDGNHCADQLAKLGARQSKEYAVLEEPPDLLIPYLSRDIEAALEFERNHE